MSCKYYINGVESKLYTELYGYMDNTAPEKKSTEAVYKILKANGIATRRNGSTYLIQANLQPSLREVNRINSKYPGLLKTQFIKTTPKTIYSPESELHTLDINPIVLQSIPMEGPETADFTYEDITELDQYARFIAGKENTDDYYLDEKARQENTSDQSKFSEMEREDRDRLEAKVVHLKEAFAKAGIIVDVQYDTELENLGEVRPGEINPVVVLNPDRVKEDTAYHEFGHIYIDMLGINDPVVAKAIAELKESPLYDRVAQNYPELTGEQLDKEVLATAIGLEGARIVRKNPTALQQLINRILRAFGKLFGVQPNTAALIAEEMFAKQLRAEGMINPLSPYVQKSKDEEKFDEIVQDLKIRIASDLYEVEQLPPEEREKKIYQLQELKDGLNKVRRIEDLLKVVNSMGRTLNASINEYERIMSLPSNERPTLENMSKIYKLKSELDGLKVMEAVKVALLQKKKDQKIFDEGKFITLEDKVRSILDTRDVYSENFSDKVIPIMAEFLSGYHNKALDPQLQAQIDNARKYKRDVFLNTQTQEYAKIKAKYKNGELTEDEFLDARVELKIEQLKDRQISGYGSLKRELRAAYKDTSTFSYLLDPLIYSNDRAIQLFVKSVQDADLRKNDMTREFKSKLNAKYNKFSEGRSESDVAKINEDLLEEVTVKGQKRLAIVNPIDQEKYYKDKQDFLKKLNIKYGQPQKKEGQDEANFKFDYSNWKRSENYQRLKKEESRWDQENSEPIDTWEKELDIVNKQIELAKAAKQKLEEEEKQDSDAYSMQVGRIKELQKFKDRNYNSFTNSPRGEWVRPMKSKYTNAKYTKIQADPTLKEYYDFILEELQAGHKMIGAKRMDKNTWDEFSYLMPSVRKKDFDRLREQGIISGTKDMFKEGFSIVETDDQFGIYNQSTGELKKKIPVYYVNRIDAKDVSRDIASSLYQFRHMAHNYKVKSETVGQVMLFRDIMENREVLQENSGGIEMINKTAEALGFKKFINKEGVSNTFKHLDEWIDTVMFGQNELKQELKGISLTKAVGALNTYTALNTLSFNLLQGTNQFILDNLTMAQEAVAKQFMSASDLAWAKTQYWFEAGAMTDIGRFDPKTKIGKAMEYFDALTEFTDHEGNRIVGGKARKLLSADNLLFLQQGVEHELSATRLLGLMRSLKGKLKDSNGKVLKNEKGELADLYDMLKIDKNGVMSVDPRVANFNRLDFIGLVQGLSRRTNQTKGKMHAPMAQRRAIGKLAMLFRSWLLPGIRRRYGHGILSTGTTLHIDEELGTLTQGTYITLFNLMRESIINKEWRYGKMSEMERQNVWRGFIEFSARTAAFALVTALANIDDDEETWASNFMLYQAKRYHSEMKMWSPEGLGGEFWRILSSPTATARPVQAGFDLLGQIGQELGYATGMPWVEEKDIFYQRKTGRFDKGDRKITKDFQDLMIGWRGVSKSVGDGPKEAYKWFMQMD